MSISLTLPPPDMHKPSWHWIVDRLLGWVVAIVVLLIVGFAACAWAQPRALPGAAIDPVGPTSSTIVLPPQATEVIEAGPIHLPDLEAVPPSRETLQIKQAGTAEVQQSLARLTQQANAPSREGAQAAWQLGLVHLHGAGVPVDPVQAQSWFERAAQSGAAQAQAGLAWCHLQGCTTPPNPDRARAAIQALRPVSRGRADYLQWLLAEQQAPVTIAQPGATRHAAPASNDRLLQAAAREGDAQARVELGIRAATQQRYADAQRWFRGASGSRAADINLQRVGDLVQREAQQPPADASRAQALFNKAQRLHRGQGGPANYTEAIRLYQQAAQLGHAPAKSMLELIFSRPAPGGQVNLVWMQQVAYVDTRQSLPRLASALNQPQLVRDPSAVFDLMPPFWQRQVHAAGI